MEFLSGPACNMLQRAFTEYFALYYTIKSYLDYLNIYSYLDYSRKNTTLGKI